MGRNGRRRTRLAGLDRLETRALLTAAVVDSGLGGVGLTDIIGNAGTIVSSQFQPYGNGVIGAEWWNIGVAGPVQVSLTTPNSDGIPPIPTPAAPANTGLIAFSQFNAGGYFKIGSQLKDVRLGRGLTVNDYDESIGRDPTATTAASTATTAVGLNPVVPALPTNVGSVLNSQFNDFGFGNIGIQGEGVSAGGGLSVTNLTLIRDPDGQVAPDATGDATTSAAPGDLTPVDTRANANLIQNSQFNDGGFGKVGLQYNNVKVRGTISVASETYAVQPGVENPDRPTPVPRPLPHGRTYGDPTNTGYIRGSQFNDGGFGDVGMQWSNVAVGGRVATSTNNLSIQPQTNGVGPITVTNKIFGQGNLGAISTSAPAQTATPDAAVSTADAGIVGTSDPLKNEATNSGRILGSQFADGGFGDVGMQWDGVAVKGNVTTADNSLSIQPTNTDQGLITVAGVQFPSDPAASTTPPSGPLQVLPPTPPLVSNADASVVPALVTPALTNPTTSATTSFLQNDATNSGTILNSQVSDGGFGDIGMQWKHVKVGAVRVVHNSFSVHPEGTALAGVNVANVAYGTPKPLTPRAQARLARNTSTTSAIIDPSQYATSGTTVAASSDDGDPGPQPKNRRQLKAVQFPTKLTAPVSLQWYAVRTKTGLVIVHNTIQIKLGDPTATAPITLSNISMPGKTPVPITITTSAAQPAATAALAGAAPSVAATTPIIDSATNSGFLNDSQFNDGGFGDIGLQWRDVKIHGTVSVIHNTMSVDVSGTTTGPINVANVNFDSGALDGITTPAPIRIISPPNYFSRLPANRKNGGTALPQDPSVVDNASNSGVLLGGQFATGGMGHIMLQWAKVGIPGSVTILDNVLSISVTGHGTDPITIQNVNFS